MTQSTNSNRIAILGANGRLSREVARAFHASGWRVRAVTRNGKSEALANLANIELVAGDAINRQDMIAATKDCDFVFNGLNPAYTDWAEKCLPMAENVLAAVKENKVVHLFPGNIYHFGSQLPETLLPDTPVHADHKKAHIRVAMEELFERESQNNGVQTIMLRAGDFYGGDGTGSWFDLGLISKLAKGKMTYPGNRNIVHAWAYLPDLAKAFVALAEKADTLSMFANFHFEGHNVTGEAMHHAFEAAMGKPLKRASIPSWLIKVAGWFSPQMREVGEVFYQWTTPHQVKDERLKQIIGALPHTPLDIAVKEALKGQGFEFDASEASANVLRTA